MEKCANPATETGSKTIQTVTLTLFRFDSVSARLWAFGMMALARKPLSKMENLSFWKLCGAGVGEGFTPRLNMGIVGILCVWDSREAADRGLDGRLFSRYRARASEDWTLFLTPVSARGAWSGRVPFTSASDHCGPMAVLTRATLKLRALPRFWGRVPDVSAAIGADPAVRFKIGLGEVPFLHQITFSVWPDPASMVTFAHRGGPHAQAVSAVRDGNWFREELYARFRVTDARGVWEGRAPLDGLTLGNAA